MTECLEWLDTLPTPNGVLEKTQSHGRESLKKLKIPNNCNEDWRGTNIKQIRGFKITS